ncbi:hypothetical protein P3T27_007415 [Kitasatospora sp. MAA19]|nr:hypothetical protein [Kitasatospora sp. MAA19]
MTSGEMLLAGLHVSSLAAGGFAAMARTTGPNVPEVGDELITVMPPQSSYELGPRGAGR